MPLGSLQKGSFDVTGAQVEGVPFATPPQAHLIELGVETKEDAIEWCNTIK